MSVDKCLLCMLRTCVSVIVSSVIIREVCMVVVEIQGFDREVFKGYYFMVKIKRTTVNYLEKSA